MKKLLQGFILFYIIYVYGSGVLFAQNSFDTIETETEPDVVKIARSWDLPAALPAVSGIAYIDDDRIACIQDEVGTIFIYNLSTANIESSIPFGPPGDYEGIALVGNDAYVACADGRIVEINDYRGENPSTKEYGTHLTVKQNVEGLCYDKKNKRLLVAIKGQEDGGTAYKGIYEFDLATKKMPVKPFVKIDLQDSLLRKIPSKKMQTLIQPSEISLNPLSGDIYITDGVRSILFVIDVSGKIKALYALKKPEFNNPEGMMFTPAGLLYIASDGSHETPGRILLVQLK